MAESATGGEATMDQVVPLKNWMLDEPTTQTSVAEIASTATEPLFPVTGRFEQRVPRRTIELQDLLAIAFPDAADGEDVGGRDRRDAAQDAVELHVDRGLDDAPGRAVEVLDEVAPLPLVPRPPTAQTSVGERAVTALSWPPAEGVATVWMLQDVPLKNSTSGVLTFSLLLLTARLSPTAQTALLDRALTPLSTDAPAPVGLGVATTDQLVPLKFSASVVSSALPEFWKPTAQMSVAETAAVALRPELATVGLVSTWKLPEGGDPDGTTVTDPAAEVLPE